MRDPRSNGWVRQFLAIGIGLTLLSVASSTALAADAAPPPPSPSPTVQQNVAELRQAESAQQSSSQEFVSLYQGAVVDKAPSGALITAHRTLPAHELARV